MQASTHIEKSTTKALMTPADLCAQISRSPKSAQIIAMTRQHIFQLLDGKDDRLLIVLGPCSIHDPDSALAYAQKLQNQIQIHKNELCIVMRTYLEKPRTSVGWKGFINDPDLNHSFQIEKGLMIARELLLKISEVGVPVGTEILNPLTAPYFSDLLSWAVIGARTAESQVHRELASSLPMPVGFKNNTNGDLQVAINGVIAAKLPQHFMGVSEDGFPATITSSGNPYCHVVLRGGQTSTNYDARTITHTVNQLADCNLIAKLMIDCNHGNSQKNHMHQSTVLQSICEHIESNLPGILGIMMESHLVAGRQRLWDNQPLTYGQSITDPCIGWEETTEALAMISNAVKKRRKSHLSAKNMVSYL